ncbi:MAG: ankyrin repeat domain-containing protein [Capsulimonadaceae bacterium]
MIFDTLRKFVARMRCPEGALCAREPGSLVSHLFDDGVDVNVDGFDRYLEIERLVRAGEVGPLDTLLEYLDDDEWRHDSGAPALILGVLLGNYKSVDIRLQNGADVDMADRDGLTALMKAAAEGRLEGVRFLLARGASVNAVTKSGETALSLALLNAQPDIVNELVAAGACDGRLDQ